MVSPRAAFDQLGCAGKLTRLPVLPRLLLFPCSTSLSPSLPTLPPLVLPPSPPFPPLMTPPPLRAPAFKLLTYYGGVKERAAKRQGWSKPNSFHVCITSYTIVLQVGWGGGRMGGLASGWKSGWLPASATQACVDKLVRPPAPPTRTLTGRAHVQAQEVEVPHPG